MSERLQPSPPQTDIACLLRETPISPPFELGAAKPFLRKPNLSAALSKRTLTTLAGENAVYAHLVIQHSGKLVPPDLQGVLESFEEKLGEPNFRFETNPHPGTAHHFFWKLDEEPPVQIPTLEIIGAGGKVILPDEPQKLRR